ncbi:YfaZ family outer membrane protein [Acidihalobacter prosperus]|nr:YfaZ family outer membrane protein [Acidihalobacter prosperus]
MRIVTVLGAGLLAASSAAMANGLDFQLGNHTAQLQFYTGSSALGYSGGIVGFGGFVNSRHDVMANASVKVEGLAAGETPLSFGLGVKAYAGSIDKPNDNVGAIALGGLVKYTIPYRMPMAVVLEGYYAPDITTFGQGKSFSDLSLDYQIEVTPGATAYAGYRVLQTDLKNYGEYKLDNALHVGIRLHF